MDSYIKISKKFTKKFGSKVISRKYFYMDLSDNSPIDLQFKKDKTNLKIIAAHITKKNYIGIVGTLVAKFFWKFLRKYLQLDATI